MTPLELASAILKAAEEATPGPWINWAARVSTAYSDRDPASDGDPLSIADCDMDTRIEHDVHGVANAAFIALARNTAPAIALALIEKHRALEEAQARIAKLEQFTSDVLAQFNASVSVFTQQHPLAVMARNLLTRQGDES